VLKGIILAVAFFTGPLLPAGEFPVVKEVVRSNGQALKNAQIRELNEAGVTIFHSEGIIKIRLSEFTADENFRKALDPGGESLTIVPSPAGDHRDDKATQTNDQPSEEPEWEPETKTEIKRLLSEYELLIVPISKTPGFYFRGIWIPLGESMSVVRKEIPDLLSGHRGSEALSFGVPNQSLYVYSGGGTQLRMLFLDCLRLGGVAAPRAAILGGLYFGDNAPKVIQILGIPIEKNLPYSVTYRGPDYRLQIGFNYGALSFITFNCRGYDVPN